MVGSLVAQCESEGKAKLADLSLEQMQSVCGQIEKDVFDTLNPTGVCGSYQSKGAAGPRDAAAQLKYWKEKIKEQ